MKDVRLETNFLYHLGFLSSPSMMQQFGRGRSFSSRPGTPRYARTAAKTVFFTFPAKKPEPGREKKEECQKQGHAEAQTYIISEKYTDRVRYKNRSCQARTYYTWETRSEQKHSLADNVPAEEVKAKERNEKV
ncbi:hypothetical protein RUM44_002640 [Polyplax serrata]|uniref:Uncharacterized protein n=1 Tax=Polyplax serrata TaxID=468196 RepID=A0ABR1AFB8_POLSC